MKRVNRDEIVKTAHQHLPTKWEQREILRNKGQFWTPAWVAEAMVTYALAGGSDHLFDPAVGAGAFFRAAKRVSMRLGRAVQLLGMEVDPAALQQACGAGLEENDLRHVALRDFLVAPPNRLFSAIVGNPPYIRHHRLSLETKQQLKMLSCQVLGKALDGRAGLHVYFLLQALRSL
jgi:type I restriction-modification system DNA methylase subunit